MSKFKVGDRVKVTLKDDSNYGATVEIKTDYRDGTVAVKFLSDAPNPYHDVYREEYLGSHSLDTLSEGDVIVSEAGIERNVTGVAGRVVFMENSNGHSYDWQTIKELKDNDWTVKQPAEDVTELTLEQVAKLAKVDVSKLRIKE